MQKDFIPLKNLWPWMVFLSLSKEGNAWRLWGKMAQESSTLLQLIAGTLAPTSGDISTNGRVAALLELGAGFNPDFTGRENAKLSAILLGVDKADLEAKIRDVVDFADIGDFIDRPVRTYSSGMYVRVAFAVQVCLIPDVLIIDEALAVGDAAFQVKCFRKLSEIRKAGVSILFVSHDIQAVRMLCERAIWLEHGKVRADGGVAEVTAEYMKELFRDSEPKDEIAAEGTDPVISPTDHPKKLAPKRREAFSEMGSGAACIKKYSISSAAQIAPLVFPHGSLVRIEVEIAILKSIEVDSLSVAFCIRHKKGLDLIIDHTKNHGIMLPEMSVGDFGNFYFEFFLHIIPDDYELILAIEDRKGGQVSYHDFLPAACIFKVVADKSLVGVIHPDISAGMSCLCHGNG